MAKRQKQKPKQHRYERRIVLFLDFLGFREIVDETERDSEKLRLLLRAIDRLYDIGRKAELDTGAVSDRGRRSQR
ncbi:hypothetical protein ACVWWO_003322 [Bradyrhizobium sp. F1.13.1]